MTHSLLTALGLLPGEMVKNMKHGAIVMRPKA